ncbi:MAG: hypothetical protein RBT45_02685 [Acholeplasmataceae bacterium]|jgi:hypothetical protein|nr:hypothetical protein [Acholeplasmataceae bacterium]
MMLILLIDPSNDIYEEMLYREHYLSMYVELTLKILTLIMPFIVIILLMDHDQLYLRPLMSYFGRKKVVLSKIVLYIMVLSFLYLLVGIYYHLIFWLLKSHLAFHLMFDVFIHLFFDALMIMVFTFYFIREKYKAFSIVFGILYLIMQFIQEDYFLLILSYVFPFYNVHFVAYSLALPYKVCYISLGFILTYRKMVVEPISST